VTRRTLVGVIAALLVYVVMWVGWVQNWAWLSAVDNWFLDGAARVAVGHRGWVWSWDLFCTVLGPTVFRIIGLIAIIVLLAQRYLRGALFLVIAVELSGLVTEVAKWFADRKRPDTAMVHAMGSSFPSGHALGVMACVLALSTILLPMVSRRWGAVLVVLGAVVVFLIGAGRVILNVHHPSDVVAGWALGFVYYAVCYAVIKPLPLTRITSRGEKPEVSDTAQ